MNHLNIAYNETGAPLTMANFGGGYFGGDGKPCYRHGDWQGSVTMITDGGHNLVQHTGYYPYGEPWREPSGQPYLYGGKERMRDGGLYEYDHGARRLCSALPLWTAPDPLALKYASVNPYAYCASNPIKFTDPSGKEWRQVRHCTGNTIDYEWVEGEDAYDQEGNSRPGVYKAAVLFTAEGKDGKKFDKDKDSNIGSSTAIVYGMNGPDDITEYDACTNPSDPNEYATVPEGDYEAQVGKHNGSYDALRVSDVGTTNFYNNKIELGQPNPSDRKKTTADGINVHKPGWGNLTKKAGNGSPISMGCFLIDINQYENFMTKFRRGVTVGITVQR